MSPAVQMPGPQYHAAAPLTPVLPGTSGQGGVQITQAPGPAPGYPHNRTPTTYIPSHPIQPDAVPRRLMRQFEELEVCVGPQPCRHGPACWHVHTSYGELSRAHACNQARFKTKPGSGKATRKRGSSPPPPRRRDTSPPPPRRRDTSSPPPRRRRSRSRSRSTSSQERELRKIGKRVLEEMARRKR